MSLKFQNRLAEHYSGLSYKLKQAGDYIARNPVDVATRSMRNVADEAKTAPATFTRLARALGYPSFESLRESLRFEIERQVHPFADRAQNIGSDNSFVGRHLRACAENIAALDQALDPTYVEKVVKQLQSAQRVFLLGALGASGIIEYMSYLAHYCTDKWHLLNRDGASMGGGLSDIKRGDALIILTKKPFAARVLRAVNVAKEQGVYVLVITDSHSCPALPNANASFIVRSESPHFYSSYVATLALLEILIGLIAGHSGQEVHKRMAKIEQTNHRLDEVQNG